ncbi:MAG: hypothetical protein HFF66_03480 [Oscillospiraceae bacterium]|nr:hypothetical protein [Oscillospiraceae bacterium]
MKKKRIKRKTFAAKLCFALAQFEKWKYDQGREILLPDEAGLTQESWVDCKENRQCMAAKGPPFGRVDIFQTSPCLLRGSGPAPEPPSPFSRALQRRGCATAKSEPGKQRGKADALPQKALF